MRKFIILLIIMTFLIYPVCAMNYTAPTAPADAQKYMPEDTESFGDGLWFVIKSAIAKLQPGMQQASKTCLSIIAISILLSIVQNFSGVSKQLLSLVGALVLGVTLFHSSNSLIQLGTQTVEQISDYGKLLFPTLAAATAANGTPGASAALYTGTVIFTTLLSSLISRLVVPLIYVLLALSIADCASGDHIFQGLKDFVKWLSTWIVKTVIYVFTGYMSITGVISGSVDAAAIKATKLTISGAVPVVGSIISDASETILLSASIMKNAAGVYGLIATVAICIGPFLQIGIHYLLLKATGAVCGVFGNKQVGTFIKDTTTIMGIILAMTGSVCLLLLISIVCFLRSLA